MDVELYLTPYKLPEPIAQTFIGVITGFDKEQGYWLIDQQFIAHVAVSLLVRPIIGDTVAFVLVKEDVYVIDQILMRDSKDNMIDIESDRKMQWQAPEISIQAQNSVEIAALNNVSVTAKHLVQSSQKSLVQRSENLMMHAEYLSASADCVMNLIAQQQLLIAEEDVRIDGNRISMG